jgi:hypothetical protein
MSIEKPTETVLSPWSTLERNFFLEYRRVLSLSFAFFSLSFSFPPLSETTQRQVRGLGNRGCGTLRATAGTAAQQTAGYDSDSKRETTICRDDDDSDTFHDDECIARSYDGESRGDNGRAAMAAALLPYQHDDDDSINTGLGHHCITSVTKVLTCYRQPSEHDP